MEKNLIESYIKLLDLDKIPNPELRSNTESIIRGYLEKADTDEALKKSSDIRELLKRMQETEADPSLLEAVEHVMGKLKGKFGPPNLVDLFEFAPANTQCRVPAVFYEHPELRKVRVLKMIGEKGRDKLVDTEIKDINQLKISHVIGNLDVHYIDREPQPAKILCGPVHYDWKNRCRYVLLNGIRTTYPHEFSTQLVGGTVHLSPRSISMRVVRGMIRQEGGRGIYFCPSCLNLFDSDEISEDQFEDTQKKVRSKIASLKIDEISSSWSFCPYCSTKALQSNDQSEVARILLFSYLYRSNYYPDVVALTERRVETDSKQTHKLINRDTTLIPYVGDAIYSTGTEVGELVKGFARLINIHKSELGKPKLPIYYWQQRKLRMGDNNIYYCWQQGQERLPACISSQIENTDALSFSIKTAISEDLRNFRPSVVADLVFSSLAILLNEDNPNANVFALDSALEAIFSYILLSMEMKLPTEAEELVKTTVQCLSSLNDEIGPISDSCKRQNLEFTVTSLPILHDLVEDVPLHFVKLQEKVDFRNGSENLSISKKLALLFWLFGIGLDGSSLDISSNKRHTGLDFDVLVSGLHNHMQDPTKVKSEISRCVEDIYLHTLSHLLYRSVVDVSRCEENDISYDYVRSDQKGLITIYDNYSGGAGFVREVVECYDNLEHPIGVRPKFGLLQQLELNTDICTNYFANYLTYEYASSLDLDKLRRTDPEHLISGIRSMFGLTDLVIERVLSKSFGKNLFPFLRSLVKQKIGIMYKCLHQTFGLEYQDIVLVQRCPTIFLFLILCKTDDYELTMVLRGVLKQRVPLSKKRNAFSLVRAMWNGIFESDSGIFYSEFNRTLLPRFEDMISTCVKGCYDCAHISFGCKHRPQEQEFWTNTNLTNYAFSAIRGKFSSRFPIDNSSLQDALVKLTKESASYFYFYLDEFQGMERLLNTFLSKCLAIGFEICQPLFTYEINGNKIKAFVKLRKRVENEPDTTKQ